MRSVEFEIMEGRTGDLTSVDGIEATTTSEWDGSVGYPWLRFSPDGGDTRVSGLTFRIAAQQDHERPSGEWNRLDLLVHGDRAIHRVNGEPVLAVAALRHEVDGEMVPLTRGVLQIQSEGAEVFFRHIFVRPVELAEFSEEWGRM